MTFTAYDSYEAAMADLEARITQLNENLLPRQRLIRDNHERQFVVAVAEDDHLVYGDIPTPDDKGNRERGYLTGMWYSDWLEQGEYGDNHVALVLFSIPERAFELARELGWPGLEYLRAARKARRDSDPYRLTVLIAASEVAASTLG